MKMNAALSPPTFVISLIKQIYCFELSPYESSSNLFCAALQNKIVLGLLRFPVSRFLCLPLRFAPQSWPFSAYTFAQYRKMKRTRILLGSAYVNWIQKKTHAVIRSPSRPTHRCPCYRSAWNFARPVRILSFAFIAPICATMIRFKLSTDTRAMWMTWPGNRPAGIWPVLATIIRAKFGVNMTISRVKWCFD